MPIVPRPIFIYKPINNSYPLDMKAYQFAMKCAKKTMSAIYIVTGAKFGRNLSIFG